ncbi:unnamed protein product [Phytophthora fragariaefolia]|uniref:Unnamed protein product n=1 Tax=Phytophthora fragariaefolia TaxID=1490495 RepID=A0A9W6YI06_9STRA|nr:unnamed protein product [Phytophthora fragariaefolia]
MLIPLSSASSLYQDAPTDVESDLASVDSQPLPPPPSRQQRRLRVTSPHLASRYIHDATNLGSSSSEELDDSNDEGWSMAESAEEDEEVTADCEDDDSAEEDISINLIDVNVNQNVTRFIKAENCERRCLQGKAHGVYGLVCRSNDQVGEADVGREKFNYYLPFVGAVCRPSFARCLDLTPLAIQRYKTRVRDGNIATKTHGNLLNKNASTVDTPWLVKWFKEFANEVGEVVPVRVRLQKTVGGKAEEDEAPMAKKKPLKAVQV